MVNRPEQHVRKCKIDWFNQIWIRKIYRIRDKFYKLYLIWQIDCIYMFFRKIPILHLAAQKQ